MSDSDPITRLNTALEGRYRIERQLGEGGMASGATAEYREWLGSQLMASALSDPS